MPGPGFTGFLERAVYYLTFLLKGFEVTVYISTGSFIVAVLLGVLLAIARLSRFRLARMAALSYTEVFRGLPPLTLLFILYFGLSYLDIRLAPITAAILGLGLGGAAYCCEIFRAGFCALHFGQAEAAKAVGLTPLQTIRHITLPQALRVALPSLANYGIALIKDTAVASAVAAPEMLYRAKNLSNETYDIPMIYLMVAIIYFCLTFPLARWSAALEHRRRVEG